MELIVAILMALGFLCSPDLYTDEYQATRLDEMDRASYIIENELYRSDDGGVITIIDETP
ncbi:MAG: hypothetical protein ACR2GN_03735 [Bacteroidia bacterium]|nr:hypothetical protein [Nitrosopumilus sp.]